MAVALFAKSDHYCKALHALWRNSNQTQNQSAWIKERLGERLLRELPANQVIHILSVGCGDGSNDLCLLEALVNQRVHYTALDPLPVMMETFQENVVHGKQYRNVEFRLVTTTCEDFAMHEKEQKYDFIHFMHSIYYVDRMDEIIVDYRNMLTQHGLLLIMTASKDNDTMQVRSSLGRNNPEIPDVQSALLQLGICYTKENIPNYIDIRPLFPNEDRTENISEEGDLLLDFITHVYKLRETTAPSVVSDCLSLIRTKSGEMLRLDNYVECFFIKANVR